MRDARGCVKLCSDERMGKTLPTKAALSTSNCFSVRFSFAMVKLKVERDLMDEVLIWNVMQ